MSAPWSSNDSPALGAARRRAVGRPSAMAGRSAVLAGSRRRESEHLHAGAAGDVDHLDHLAYFRLARP